MKFYDADISRNETETVIIVVLQKFIQEHNSAAHRNDLTNQMVTMTRGLHHRLGTISVE